eukprot:TRINITY_DN204_c5_g1_i1.p1 TRINITY_DN204_c5_g1~~TRINITY_DN204_c5_g1_i1.p1  ORF type:complete len:625 (-),score=267.97 TRINITY_DN204_c5_g1_i1:3-1877(-)
MPKERASRLREDRQRIQASIAAGVGDPSNYVNSEKNNKSLNENETSTLGMIQLIDSEDAIKRENACLTLAQVAFDEADLIIEKGFLQRLCYRLKDQNEHVRLAAFSALRNLSFAGEKVCKLMIDNQILPIIFENINQNYILLSNQIQNLPIEQIDFAYSLLTQTISLLLHISANFDEIITIVTNHQIAPILLKYISYKTPSQRELSVVTAQYLALITEENPDCCLQLRTPEIINQLKEFIINQNSDIQIKAILSNVVFSMCLNNTEKLQSIELFLPQLLQSLEQPTFLLISQLKDELENEKFSIKPFEEKFTLWMNNIDAQICVLELIADICTHFIDLENETNDQDMNLENEIDDNDENLTNENLINDDNNSHTQNYLPQILIDAFINSQLLNKVFDKSNLIPDNICNADWPDKVLVNDRINLLQSRALSCMNNLLIALPSQSIPLVSIYFNSFSQLCGQAIQKGLNDILQSATALMWTLLRNAKSSLTLNEDHIKAILHLTATSIYCEDIRSGAAAMLGIIGKMECAINYLPSIASILLQLLNENSALIIAEALNSIFDLFAENEYNELVKSSNMLNILKAFLPTLKQKVKTEKRSLEKQIWNRLDEARINLSRFLQYKNKQF